MDTYNGTHPSTGEKWSDMRRSIVYAGELVTPIYRGQRERERGRDTVYKEGPHHTVAEQHGVVGGAAAAHTPPLTPQDNGRWEDVYIHTTPPPTAPQAQAPQAQRMVVEEIGGTYV